MGGDAVAGGHRLVAEGFGPLDQGLVVGGGEEKAALFGVEELLQQHVRQRDGQIEIGPAPARLQQLQQCVEQQRVVVQVGVQVRVAVLVGRQQPAVAPQVAPDKVQRTLSGVQAIGAIQHPGGAGHALDHQRVPGCQDLLVPPRSHAPLPRRQQFGLGGLVQRARPRRRQAQLGGNLRQAAIAVQVPLALEVGRLVQTV